MFDVDRQTDGFHDQQRCQPSTSAAGGAGRTGEEVSAQSWRLLGVEVTLLALQSQVLGTDAGEGVQKRPWHVFSRRRTWTTRGSAAFSFGITHPRRASLQVDGL